MTEKSESTIGMIALVLCLGGVVLAAVIGLVARLAGYQADRQAYLVFIAFQVAAIVLGLKARRTPFGKAAAITAAVLAVGSLAFMA